MADNPYGVPRSNLDRKDANPPVQVPADVLSKIRSAWIAAVVSGTITLLFTLAAMAGHSVLGISAANFVDVALIFGLAFGIYRKSRTCAVLMLVYFLASKIYMIQQNGAAGAGGILGVVFLVFYAMGVMGTFQYHKIVKT